jgi:hypothetical protein
MIDWATNSTFTGIESMETKAEAMTARLNLKTFPEIVELVGIESSRLRKEGLKFGQRQAKQAIVVMTAIDEFMSLTEDARDKIYLKRMADYEKRLQKPHKRKFASQN